MKHETQEMTYPLNQEL